MRTRQPLFSASNVVPSKVAESTVPGVAVSYPIRVLTVVGASIVSGLAVAFVASLIERATDVSLYGLSAAVVIPIGAVACGLVASLGFSIASRLFHVRPVGLILAVPLVSAAVAFLASHWLSFNHSRLPAGTTFAEAFALDGRGFIDYLQMVATESGLPTGSSAAPATVDQIGSWGYGVVAIQIVGFALGGWFVAAFLRRSAWCEASRQFMNPVGKHVQYFDDATRFESTANHLVDVLEMGGPVAAFEHAKAPKPTLKQRRNNRFRLTVAHFECDHCRCAHTVIATQHRVNNNWARLSETPLHPDPASSSRHRRNARLVS